MGTDVTVAEISVVEDRRLLAERATGFNTQSIQ
jgi:hypothetical protein